LLTLGGQSVKSVNHYKNLGIALDTELSDDKDIHRQLYQYCAAKKLRACFTRCSNVEKMYFFFPSVRACMHHNYGVISGRHAQARSQKFRWGGKQQRSPNI